jgi:hypothetical protein
MCVNEPLAVQIVDFENFRNRLILSHLIVSASIRKCVCVCLHYLSWLPWEMQHKLGIVLYLLCKNLQYLCEAKDLSINETKFCEN